jgi:hypothetical protein
MVPPFSEAGVPSDKDDLVTAWKALKVSPAVGLTRRPCPPDSTNKQHTMGKETDKKRKEIQEEGQGALYVRTLTTEELEGVRAGELCRVGGH